MILPPISATPPFVQRLADSRPARSFLVDNSVLQRLPGSSGIRRAIQAILTTEDDLCYCSATLDELAFSARSESSRETAIGKIRSGFKYLPTGPAIDERVIDIRAALFRAGMGRGAGVIDVQIAATAAHYGAIVLHYDTDFDLITRAYPQARSQWAVPRGTVT